MIKLLAHTSLLRKYFPAIAFFGGFIWDAWTIGQQVNVSDLWMLSAYMLAVIPIIWWMAIKTERALRGGSQVSNDAVLTPNTAHPNATQTAHAEEDAHWRTRLPYMMIQFLFGSLFSALFILYFKSSSHMTAIVWSIGLGALLVANEYLEQAYKRFSLTWTLFGFCAILLLNFVVPFVVGSVHAIWFYVSVIVAVLLTRVIKARISSNLGSLTPFYCVAACISLAYVLDVIPPVPLVKRDIEVGTHLEKVAGEYRVLQDKAPWWIFWRSTLASVQIGPGEQVYCISAIFAPKGLEAKLYHRWQYYAPKTGWVTRSRIGFQLAGGRDNGFRGYTYKHNLDYGQWRVRVETENGRTIATHDFELLPNEGPSNKAMKAL